MAERLGELLKRKGHVHFIGIGGVGMAGLARLLLQAGFEVSGSDTTPNRLTRELEAQGVTFFNGHHPSQVTMAPDWAVRTPAVGEGNPEVDRLRAENVPLFVRGQVLAAVVNARRGIAVAGAHGKTTTTSMLASLLSTAGKMTGYAVGGETELPGRVADAGQHDAFVFEADESDGTLVHYQPEVGFLTHVEWDHVERFRSEEALLQCYRKFVQGCGTVWIREGDALAERVCSGKRKVNRVGRSPAADLRMLRADQTPDGQTVRFQMQDETHAFTIPLPGEHNAWNGLMAVAGALHLGVPADEACKALSCFQGVARRFQKLEKNGVMLIQDYAHHPTEIRAVMQSAKALRPGRIWLVFQPHRFSRTRHLLADFVASFSGADRLALLPVYAASELSTQGVGSDQLAEKCRKQFSDIRVYADQESLIKAWAPDLRPGDLILIAGAGDVNALQQKFANALD